MAMYKVTVHEHKIYETFIDSPEMPLALEIAENQVTEDNRSTWHEDYNAGWTEVSEIVLADDGEYLDEEWGGA